jgi:predicted DNA-binding protein
MEVIAMEKQLVATRIPTQMHNALKDLAKRQDRKVAYFVRKAVEEYIEREHKSKRRS